MFQDGAALQPEAVPTKVESGAVGAPSNTGSPFPGPSRERPRDWTLAGARSRLTDALLQRSARPDMCIREVPCFCHMYSGGASLWRAHSGCTLPLSYAFGRCFAFAICIREASCLYCIHSGYASLCGRCIREAHCFRYMHSGDASPLLYAFGRHLASDICIREAPPRIAYASGRRIAPAVYIRDAFHSVVGAFGRCLASVNTFGR